MFCPIYLLPFPQNNLGQEGQLNLIISWIIALNLTVSFGSSCLLLLSMEFSHGDNMGEAYFSVLHLCNVRPTLHGPVSVNALLPLSMELRWSVVASKK